MGMDLGAILVDLEGQGQSRVTVTRCKNMMVALFKDSTVYLTCDLKITRVKVKGHGSKSKVTRVKVK